MEGPSLYLAAKQLKPFKGETVTAVSGNTSIDKGRVLRKEVLDVFAWGKHLVLQFDTFALRTHFLLFGTFEAQVEKKWVTGDYRKAREPRLALRFRNGRINMYNCSIKFIESAKAKAEYDFTVDIMARQWDPDKAIAAIASYPKEMIADVLLDQTVFAGVGNIIKNEVLSIVRVNPMARIEQLKPAMVREIVSETRKFSKQFLRWRERFVLRKNLKAHGRGVCPHCGGKLLRQKTGKRARWSYWCPHCQPILD